MQWLCVRSLTDVWLRLRNDLYCVEWDVKPWYTIPYLTDVWLRAEELRICSALPGAPYSLGRPFTFKSTT